jgi:hypothetical protein
MQIEGYTYIQHKLLNRAWGATCQFTFARPDGTHINSVVTIPSMDVTNQDLIDIVSAYLARKKAREDLAATYSHILDNVVPEVKEAVFWLIAKIREYPTATIAQAETQWDLVWADGLFDFDRLLSHVQKLAGDITWEQFKTYVINWRFEGLD